MPPAASMVSSTARREERYAVDTASNSAEHIAPMRPPCQDGVIISDGLLFWGPWMCGCQLSLYGHICLGSGRCAAHGRRGAGTTIAAGGGRSDSGGGLCRREPAIGLPINTTTGAAVSPAATVPESVKLLWERKLVEGQLPTAPIVAGDTVFVADRSGSRTCPGDATVSCCWSTATGGAVYYPPTLDDGRLFAGSADGRVYALEAATGRLLWSYRVAPQARWIPVYGRLMSTWPVAGGVAVQDGVVYAAAGIAHYDGTYVVALDAVTGKAIWKNDTSGALAEDVNCGISLQGELQVRGR